MKNNKAFTLVEVIVAFVLTSIVLVLLLNIAVTMKENSVRKSVKLDLITKQALVSDKINSDLIKNNILSIVKCETDCYDIKFVNGETKRLVVQKNTNYINYDNYATVFDKGTVLSGIDVYIDEIDDKRFLMISIEIEHPLLDKKLKIEASNLYKDTDAFSIEG